MTDSKTQTDFDEQSIERLVAAFYQNVKGDDLLGPMYPVETEEEWAAAEKRLRDFLVFRFGGSDLYIKERGHPRLGMRHAPFKIGIAERDRWLLLMKKAMKETDVSVSDSLNLRTFFEQVANFLRNQE